MREGWIPLWRKVLDNEIFRRDHTAWRVFETLLVLADRRTKSWEGGRKQLADYAGLKDGATYKAIKRLEKAKMVTLSSNNKFSVISICNWDDHQVAGNSPSNNKVTTKSQQSNTLTINKTLRIKNKLLSTNVLSNSDENITTLLATFEKEIGKITRRPQQVKAAVELLRDHGLERAVGAIRASAACRDQRYAPSIGSLEDLRDKWVQLETFYRRQSKLKGVIKI